MRPDQELEVLRANGRGCNALEYAGSHLEAEECIDEEVRDSRYAQHHHRTRVSRGRREQQHGQAQAEQAPAHRKTNGAVLVEGHQRQAKHLTHDAQRARYESDPEAKCRAARSAKLIRSPSCDAVVSTSLPRLETSPAGPRPSSWMLMLIRSPSCDAVVSTSLPRLETSPAGPRPSSWMPIDESPPGAAPTATSMISSRC
ncbi:hypothetical protein T492DRAFT_361037 [Pavlovales sp. CCMP2436]|nr:hypothetical protein T492DRAFT_361037 [Pavlovales sp. CCMP2436]|mmetsp:Transcript_11302/g.26826  ORF Transcript_11302/g.26826 Transcript_11302/m.26826 type:complete len:200 (-) Transcript_11302:131-730(-)